jgi:CheY-like chemotaxis protein
MNGDPGDLHADSVSGVVLCIEDEPISMDVVEAMLEAFPGVRLLKAVNGVDGVRLARSARPDLVLLDMHLPDISGLEVVRELSEMISGRQLRVVLLTADSFSIDVVKAMSLGAHEYWPKPLTVERVTSGLRRVLGAVSSDRAGLAQTPTSTGSA